MPLGHGAAPRGSPVPFVYFALPVAAGLVEAIRRAWVCDDIFITFRYVDQWSRGYGLVYNAGEHVEGYTHFLWAIVLAALHRLGFDLVTVGRYLPIAAYAAMLVVLFRRSMTSGRGWLAAPLAAWGLALHKDAQFYASSGLETSFFALALLVGLLIVTGERERIALAAWVYAVASLLRPEGVLYAATAGIYVLWRWRDVRHVAAFGVIWSALFAPFLLWRLTYYHSWLPNAAYAKSASLAWWSQGWWYTCYYFGIYSVLALCIAISAGAWGFLFRRRPRPDADVRPRAIRQQDLAMLAGLQILLTVLYVTRVGGDFMFARFYIPITPIIYLLCEDALRRLGSARILAAAAVAVAALTLTARIPRDRIFVGLQHVHGITDEPSYYPPAVLDAARHRGEVLERCLAGTGARIRLASGDDAVAYFGHLDYAMELNGLTDADVARFPLGKRGRPGHEKVAPHELLVRKDIQIQLLHGVSSRLPKERSIQFEDVNAQIIFWDPAFMQRLASSPGVAFTDFPSFVDGYITQIGSPPRQRLLHDYASFLHFYFSSNPDSARLQRLRGALLATGIEEESLANIERGVKPCTPVLERMRAEK